MPTDLAPHDLTSNTSHSPFRVSATSDNGVFYEPFRAFDNASTYWLGIHAGVDILTLELDISFQITPHDLTSNSSHSPLVVSASSAPFFGAYSVLDGSPSTYWLGGNAGVDWLEIDFGSGNTYAPISYTVRVNTIPEPNRAPKDWTFEGSNDNSSWTVIDTVTNQTSWSSGELRGFVVDNISTQYRYFRINITANNGDATYTQIQELSIYIAATSGAKKICGSYDIKVNSVPEPNRAPKNWTFEGTNDFVTWDVLHTTTNQSSWTSGETRTFNCDVATTAYIAFRLNITANNGDSTYTQVQELFVYEVVANPALTETVTDSNVPTDALAILAAGLKSAADTLALSDAIVALLTTPLEIVKSDTLVLADSLATLVVDIEIKTRAVSDSLLLSDVTSYFLGDPPTGGLFRDTLTLVDKVFISLTGGIGDAYTLSDHLDISARVNRSLGDTLVISDFLRSLINSNPSVADQLVLSDRLRDVLGIGLLKSDTIALSDTAPIVRLSVNINKTVSDTLALSDAVSVSLSTALDSYIRHYLNDVVR